MSVRAEQKEQTKRTIMMAALTSLSSDRSYASLSLREVARLAQIAPTSFYRHFKDLEDLGVGLAQQAGETLREMIAQAPQELAKTESPTKAAVDLFLRFVQNEPHKFRFLMREKSGSSQRIRTEIKNLYQMFVDELAQFLLTYSQQNNRPLKRPTVVAEAMVTIALTMGEVYLDSTEEQLPDVYERFVSQLTIIALGAERWSQDNETSSLRQ